MATLRQCSQAHAACLALAVVALAAATSATYTYPPRTPDINAHKVTILGDLRLGASSQKASLICSSVGLQQAEAQSLTLSWSHAGRTLSSSDSMHRHTRGYWVVSSLVYLTPNGTWTEHDAGTYTCTATDTRTGLTSRATFYLEVKIPARAVNIFSQAAQLGEDQVILCVAHGSFPVTYEWTVPGSTTPSKITTLNDTRSTLYVLDVDKQKLGLYLCNARNAYGSGSLNISFGPQCRDPGTPVNGGRSNVSTMYQSVVTYHCNTGYNLTGPASRTCTEHGTWSDTMPRCQRPRCPDLVAPANGAKASDPSQNSSAVAFRCNVGYRLVGPALRVCEVDGSWSGMQPKCRRIKCADPGVPRNGSRSLQGRRFGETVTYACDAGYATTDVLAARCIASGTWSSGLPTCTIVTCPDPVTPTNGTKIIQNTVYQSVVRYQCNAGNILIGSASRTCDRNGAWNGTLPTCKFVPCPDPGTPAFGRKSKHTSMFGSVVSYQCDIGHNLVGMSYSTCNKHGDWSPMPICVVATCPDLGTLANGTKIQNSSVYQSVVTYRCDPGFNLTGSALRTCNEHGSWTGTQPSCQHVQCADPGIPLNGTRKLQGRGYNDIVEYECDTGYTTNDTLVAWCTHAEVWSSAVPICTRVECPDPGTPANGLKRGLSSPVYENAVTYECAVGYNLTGSQSLVCTEFGNWSDNMPTCNRVLTDIQCEEPARPLHGRVTFDSLDVGSTANFTCDTFYILSSDEKSLHCTDTGVWSNSIPYCQHTVLHVTDKVVVWKKYITIFAASVFGGCFFLFGLAFYISWKAKMRLPITNVASKELRAMPEQRTTMEDWRHRTVGSFGQEIEEEVMYNTRADLATPMDKIKDELKERSSASTVLLNKTPKNDGENSATNAPKDDAGVMPVDSSMSFLNTHSDQPAHLLQEEFSTTPTSHDQAHLISSPEPLSDDPSKDNDLKSLAGDAQLLCEQIQKLSERDLLAIRGAYFKSRNMELDTPFVTATDSTTTNLDQVQPAGLQTDNIALIENQSISDLPPPSV